MNRLGISQNEYQMIFSIAEDVPDQDVGSHAYKIIEGIRYRIDASSILSLPTNRDLRKNLESIGLEEIRKINHEHIGSPILRMEITSRYQGWFGLLNRILTFGDKKFGT